MMKNIIYTQNRELSWLHFNERVMDEAKEKDVPAFEKLKFLSIFTSNLDEFFMIRVGSLYDQTFLPKPQIDSKTGLNAEEQLNQVFQAVAPLYKKRDKLYKDVIKLLADKGISYIETGKANTREKRYMENYFVNYVKPILSPQIINAHHPFPHLTNKALYVALLLKIDDKEVFGIVPVPTNLERLVLFPGERIHYALLENIVCKYADEMFDNCEIEAKSIISVTRNADVNIENLVDDDDDFRHQMKQVLKKRARLAPVRLEYYKDIDRKLKNFLVKKLELKEEQVFGSKVPLEMSYVFSLPDKMPGSIVSSVTYEPFEPQQPKWFVPDESILQRVMSEDLFLSYPYEEMKPFLKLLKEASYDPRVISIKITIYRLAGKAKMVDYLRMAAENGKEVTVIMELRARFDEENNINWSESLEEAGCTVIYGLKDYKVHSKVCQITLMDKKKIKRVTQVGTGNYNEKTAKLYTDMSLITADEEIGKDAAEYFKNMAIGNLNGRYDSLLVAPNSMKNKILALIQGEIEKAKNGLESSITIKINSLTDRDTIEMLREASQAGVRIRMIIRGICCLLPGVEGYTDNIYITSVVGRFLEHSRVYCFGCGDDMKMYISSADFMTRNLNRRVEVACPVKSPRIRKTIMEILELMLEDNVKGRIIGSDGLYERKKLRDSDRYVDSQNELLKLSLMNDAAYDRHDGQIRRKTHEGIFTRIKQMFED